MGDYLASPMVQTPWGDSSELRDRRLHPGAGTPRAEVARNQRERLFGAIVAVVSEKGYEATTVADVLELSGVSRSAFYEHFANKAECLTAAAAELVEPTLAALGSAASGGRRVTRGRARCSRPSSASCRSAAGGGAGLLRRAARGGRGGRGARRSTALRGAGERAGPEAGRRIRRAIARWPPELVRALIGGLRKLIHTRLARGEEAELERPGAGALAMAGERRYPPPRPLAAPRRQRSARGSALRGLHAGRTDRARGGGGDRREGLRGDEHRRHRRAGVDLAQHLLRAFRRQARRGARRAWR